MERVTFMFFHYLMFEGFHNSVSAFHQTKTQKAIPFSSSYHLFPMYHEQSHVISENVLP